MPIRAANCEPSVAWVVRNSSSSFGPDLGNRASRPARATADPCEASRRTMNAIVPAVLMSKVSHALALERDVVAEPGRLLGRVGVAVHVHQQTEVVGGLPVGRRGAGQVGQAQRDDGLAHAVLHRLAQPEVGGVGQRRDQLRDPYPAARCASGHTGSVATAPGYEPGPTGRAATSSAAPARRRGSPQQPVDHLGLLEHDRVRRAGDDRELGVGQRADHRRRVLDRQHVVVAEQDQRRRLHPGEVGQVEARSLGPAARRAWRRRPRSGPARPARPPRTAA